MNDELKPCPFCGQEPQPRKAERYGNEVSPAFIKCRRCNYYVAVNDWPDSDAKVVELWNTRPIEGALQAEVTALKEAARRIPVSERMPPRNVRVRVWINGTESIARHSWVVPQWETIDGLYYHGDTLDDVTHWQPIPEYPEDGEG